MSFDRLVAMLDKPDLREDAIRQLGERADPRAIEPLEQLLLNHDVRDARAYRVRQLAAEALGSFDHPRALRALMIGLEDVSSLVKVSAADALGRLAKPIAVDSLVETLEDDNADVRIAVLRALDAIARHNPDAEIPYQRIVYMLADFDDTVRDVAAEVLGKRIDAAYPALEKGLFYTNSTIRGAAANILGERKIDHAYDMLRRVSLEDESEWVRSRAKWALDQLPPREIPEPRVNRDRIDPPEDTIKLMRSQSPEWPSLRQQQTAVPDPDTMSADEIRNLLDQLDMRLVNGEISEAVYKKLHDRWQARLRQLGE